MRVAYCYWCAAAHEKISFVKVCDTIGLSEVGARLRGAKLESPLQDAEAMCMAVSASQMANLLRVGEPLRLEGAPLHSLHETLSRLVGFIDRSPQETDPMPPRSFDMLASVRNLAAKGKGKAYSN